MSKQLLLILGYVLIIFLILGLLLLLAQDFKRRNGRFSFSKESPYLLLKRPLLSPAFIFLIILVYLSVVTTIFSFEFKASNLLIDLVLIVTIIMIGTVFILLFCLNQLAYKVIIFISSIFFTLIVVELLLIVIKTQLYQNQLLVNNLFLGLSVLIVFLGSFLPLLNPKLGLALKVKGSKQKYNLLSIYLWSYSLLSMVTNLLLIITNTTKF